MKVLFIDSVHPFLEKKLSEAGMTCVMGSHMSPDEVDQNIHQYQGLVIRSRMKMDEERLKKSTQLKFIARAGSGLENIDLNYCQQHHIDCFNAPEANCKAVGEHAIGMILTLFNKLITGNQEMRKGLWRREENRGLELGHRTVGIIGYGHNGKAFAKLLTAFGTKVLAYDKYAPVEEEGLIQSVSLEELQRHADIVSFHVPLTDETHYYFDNVFLDKMQQPFYLINTSRGKVAKTKTIVDGLESKKILGACLDVLEYEKASFENIGDSDDHPEMNYLLNANNVILSPHVAGWSIESHIKLSEVLATKILFKYATLL